MADLYVNGIAASSRNWYLEVAPDLANILAPTWSVDTAYRARGVTVTALQGFRERRITLQGGMVTSANTVQQLRAAEDGLKDLLGSGLLTIQPDDDATPERVIDGYLVDLTFERVGHPLRSLKSTVHATLLCPEGDWRAPYGTAIAMPTAGTRYSLPLGTAPSPCIVRIMGAANGPRFKIRTAAGVVVVDLDFSTNVTANNWMELDCERGAAEFVSAGVRSTVLDELLGSSAVQLQFPFALDPAWGDWTNSTWPTAEVDLGSAEVLYTKRYR